jgi:hypothetical protein
VQWCELLSAGFGILDVLECVQSLQTPPRTPHMVVRLHQPHTAINHPPHNPAIRDTTPPNPPTYDSIPHDSIPHDSIPDDSIPDDSHNISTPREVIYEHFRNAFPSYAVFKIHRLVKVAEQFAKSDGSQFLTELLAPKALGEITIAQAISTYKIVKDSSVRRYGVKDSLVRRYGLHLADAVERYTTLMTETNAPKMKKTVAYNHFWKELNVDREAMVAMINEGDKYLECMLMGGAALHYTNVPTD